MGLTIHLTTGRSLKARLSPPRYSRAPCRFPSHLSPENRIDSATALASTLPPQTHSSILMREVSTMRATRAVFTGLGEGLTRRRFLAAGAFSAGGLALADLLRAEDA